MSSDIANLNAEETGMEELYAKESIEITRPTVLLVEGKDDKLFFDLKRSSITRGCRISKPWILVAKRDCGRI